MTLYHFVSDWFPAQPEQTISRLVEDEYNEEYTGFRVTLEYIHSNKLSKHLLNIHNIIYKESKLQIRFSMSVNVSKSQNESQNITHSLTYDQSESDACVLRVLKSKACVDIFKIIIDEFAENIRDKITGNYDYSFHAYFNMEPM